MEETGSGAPLPSGGCEMMESDVNGIRRCLGSSVLRESCKHRAAL